MYLVVKYIHMITAVCSMGGFVVRGLMMMRDSPLLHDRRVRILPHANDTLLLAAALTLAAVSGQYPFVTDWVTAKVFGVILYIILGALALRDAGTLRLRVAYWIAALLVFGWIASVALLRDPRGILARLS